MAKEYIMLFDYVLYNEDTGEACFKPTMVGELVRCRYCKWWDKVDNIDGVNYGTCERKCTAIRKDAIPNENWFCADGVRKDG